MAKSEILLLEWEGNTWGGGEACLIEEIFRFQFLYSWSCLKERQGLDKFHGMPKIVLRSVASHRRLSKSCQTPSHEVKCFVIQAIRVISSLRYIVLRQWLLLPRPQALSRSNMRYSASLLYIVFLLAADFLKNFYGNSKYLVSNMEDADSERSVLREE